MLTNANCLLVVVHMPWFVLISYFLVFAQNMPLEIGEVKYRYVIQWLFFLSLIV